MSVVNEPRSGRKVDEWKMRPEAHDNHWFDGGVGCAVARTLARPTGSPTANLPYETLAFLRRISSMCGCVLAGTDTAQVRKPAKPKVKLSELRRRKAMP